MYELNMSEEMRAFARRYQVKISLLQVFSYKKPMWAITSSKYNMHDRKHVEMHNKILNTINGVG